MPDALIKHPYFRAAPLLLISYAVAGMVPFCAALLWISSLTKIDISLALPRELLRGANAIGYWIFLVEAPSWTLFLLLNSIFGLPRRLGKWFYQALLGFACGSIVALSYLALLHARPITASDIIGFIKGCSFVGAFGALGGLSFWVTWTWLTRRQAN
ncbi:MAG: hypothetical protein EP347_12850 [Alphaproteobacteria bacterium]|nr:MAG: hypothetical protein EP347_12850 [Alphaproteobacteria bacterium]